MRLRAEKMLTVAAGDNVVRLLPPLIVSEQEIAEGVARLDRACARLERRPRQGALREGDGADERVRHFLDLIDVPAADLRGDDRGGARHESRSARATPGRSPARRWR